MHIHISHLKVWTYGPSLVGYDYENGIGISWLVRASIDTLGSISRLRHRRSEDYFLEIVPFSEHNRSNQASWYLTNAAGDEHYTGYVQRHFSDFLNGPFILGLSSPFCAFFHISEDARFSLSAFFLSAIVVTTKCRHLKTGIFKRTVFCRKSC